MFKFSTLFIHSYLLFQILPVNAAAIDPSTLIKVDKANNPKCVEYYNYQGSIYCSTKALNSKTTVDPNLRNYEKQQLVFDDRLWQPAWGKNSEEITTIEYVPAGDDVENWQELVTSQFMPGLQNQITAPQYVDSIIEQLKNSGLNAKINIIESNPDQVLFEFHILSPENLKQDEIQLITKGTDGFYILHYAYKKSDMGDKNREKWIKILKESKTP